MLSHSCRDHTESFQSHGFRVPLLFNVQSWSYIVTLASSPRRGACPCPDALASDQNAMAERMETARRHAGTGSTEVLKMSPDHFVVMARSRAGAFKLFDLLMLIDC